MQCPEFELIEGVANAYKHLKTRKMQAVSSAGACYLVAVVNAETVVSEAFPQECGKDDKQVPLYTSEPPTDIAVRMRDGQEKLLTPALKEVIDFWQKLSANDFKI